MFKFRIVYIDCGKTLEFYVIAEDEADAIDIFREKKGYRVEFYGITIVSNCPISFHSF